MHVQVVEAALAIMRLSCEGFFVLLAVYLAYLLRAPARALGAGIRIASTTSYVFQCAMCASLTALLAKLMPQQMPQLSAPMNVPRIFAIVYMSGIAVSTSALYVFQ